MATPNRPPTGTQYSEQNMDNYSFDTDYGVNTFEMLGFDPLGNSGAGALKRVTVNALGEYYVNDIEELANISYVGKEDPAGSWFIQSIDTSTGNKSFRYATITNNSTTTDYTTAWSNRAGLTYGTYGAAF